MSYTNENFNNQLINDAKRTNKNQSQDFIV